jgi:hypothetical protein
MSTAAATIKQNGNNQNRLEKGSLFMDEHQKIEKLLYSETYLM